MVDLSVFEVRLRNLTGPLPVQAVRAHTLNGLFHTEMGRRHPALVDELHNDHKPMPFSLAAAFDEGEFLGFRVGTLTADFGQKVAEVWGGLAAQRAEVQLGSAQMIVEEVKPGGLRPTTYAQMLADAPVAHGVWLQFETPVRLKFLGQAGVLPIPRALWQFYAQKWETFAPPDAALPPELLRWVERCVQATEVQLETCYAFVEKDIEWKGVMGTVEYQAYVDSGDVPLTRVPDYLRAWQALALYADFCGTGEKATMGMGRTRRVKVFGRHREK